MGSGKQTFLCIRKRKVSRHVTLQPLTLVCTLNPRGAWSQQVDHTVTHTNGKSGFETNLEFSSPSAPLFALLEPVSDGFNTF